MSSCTGGDDAGDSACGMFVLAISSQSENKASVVLNVRLVNTMLIVS